MTPQQAKELRERLGLNFKEMGELIGVKHRQVRRYETGDSNITGAVKKNYEHLVAERERLAAERKRLDEVLAANKVFLEEFTKR